MINYLIFENDVVERNKYYKIIKSFYYDIEDGYMIYEFDIYNKDVQSDIDNISGLKVYLISLDMPYNNGFTLAKRIRESGDYRSPIILLSKNNIILYHEKLRNLLYIDYIVKDNKLIGNLSNSLRVSYNIIVKGEAFVFAIHDELFRIPIEDIYYIVKNSHNDTITIYTNDESYVQYITIKKTAELLEHHSSFLKVHRSCIVNLDKIHIYDIKENLIIFDNGMETDLISRRYKKILIDKIKNNKSIKISMDSN